MSDRGAARAARGTDLFAASRIAAEFVLLVVLNGVGVAASFSPRH